MKLTGIPVHKFSIDILKKAYVRVLLEDDTFVTDFGTPNVDGETVEITWNKPLYFKLQNPSKDPESFIVYLMFCLNTEAEISFIDQMVGNVSE